MRFQFYRTYVEELHLPSLEYGPRPEPERFATRYILNDGTMTQEAYDELTRNDAWDLSGSS